MKENRIKRFNENSELNISDVIQRDIWQELRYIGLTSDQCSEVLELIDTLPIQVKGVDNIKVSILHGIITVEPNHVV